MVILIALQHDDAFTEDKTAKEKTRERKSK